MPAAAGQTPENPALDSAVDRNQIQECMVWNLDQDHKKDKDQDPLQKLTRSMTCMAWNI